MKMNAWSCALATDRDLESGLSKMSGTQRRRTMTEEGKNGTHGDVLKVHTEAPTYTRTNKDTYTLLYTLKHTDTCHRHIPHTRTHVTHTYHTYHTCHTVPHKSHITRRPPYHIPHTLTHTHAHMPHTSQTIPHMSHITSHITHHTTTTISPPTHTRTHQTGDECTDPRYDN